MEGWAERGKKKGKKVEFRNGEAADFRIEKLQVLHPRKLPVSLQKSCLRSLQEGKNLK